MAMKSMLWAAPTSGDGASAYTEAESTRLFRILTGNAPATEGVLLNILNAFAGTGASSPVTIDTGSAFVYGYFVWDEATNSVVIPTPVIGTTGHRIVLRCNHSAKTVRVTLISSSDGVATLPAITQSAGVTWDLPLYGLTITTGGAISLTNERAYCHFATAVKTAMIDDDAVTNAKMRNSAALSVIGRATNSTGDPADIATSADGDVLRRAGTALGFGTVATAGIANDAVTTDKIAANAVGDTDLRDSAALSVIGRATNSTGDPADIAAGSDGQVLRRSGTALGFGTVANAGIASDAVTTDKIAANAVGDTDLRDSAALSVIGRATNSTGDPADIAAGSDGQVLRRAGTALGFGTVATAGIANDAVDDTKLRNSAATSVIGRAAGTSGDPTDIAASADGQVLHRSGGALGFGQAVTADITDNAITDVKLRNSAAASVIGRAPGTSGDPADIAASADGQVLHRSGGALGFGQAVTADITDDAITNAKLRNSAAASVIGRAPGTGGDPADIAASADGQVLHRAGGALAFGQAVTADLTDNAITDAKLRDSGGLTVIGRASGTAGDPADITASADGQVLHRAGGALAFGQAVTADIADNAVTNGKFRDSVGTSVIGRASGTTGDPADIVAGSDGQVLRRSGGNLTFGTVSEDGIATGAVTINKIGADAVDDTKVGDRVPQFYRRQGGDATNWSVAGTATYTPEAVRMQSGVVSESGAPATSGYETVIFPTSFSAYPIVILTALGSAALQVECYLYSVSNTQFIIYWQSSALTAPIFNWLAIGPE